MSTPTEAFIVTSGSYSDYSIQGIYLDRDVADRHADLGNQGQTYHDCQVEVFPIRTEPPRKRSLLTVSQGPNDAKPVEWTYDELVWDEDDEFAVTSDLRGVWVRGHDHKRIRKVFGERIAEWRVLYGQSHPDPVVRAAWETKPDHRNR